MTYQGVIMLRIGFLFLVILSGSISFAAYPEVIDVLNANSQEITGTTDANPKAKCGVRVFEPGSY